jgi:hypothetical protein
LIPTCAVHATSVAPAVPDKWSIYADERRQTDERSVLSDG